jgi:hypothetical protein
MKFKRAADKLKEKSEDATAGNKNYKTRVAKTRGAKKANNSARDIIAGLMAPSPSTSCRRHVANPATTH